MTAMLFVVCSTLRGLSRHCPTLHKVWSSQQVTDIVSSIVGIPVRPVMDYELGVCNIQVPRTVSVPLFLKTLHFLCSC